MPHVLSILKRDEHALGLARSAGVQAYYFMGQMAAMVTETIAWSHRYDLYQEAVAASSVTANIAFEDWCLSSNSEGENAVS